jgi:hypothetical protein
VYVVCARVAAYAYLNGEMHVKVSIAMDAVIRDLCKQRKATPAYLCTPTDVHVINPEAHAAAASQYSQLSLFNLGLKLSIFNLPGMPYLVCPVAGAEHGGLTENFECWGRWWAVML